MPQSCARLELCTFEMARVRPLFMIKYLGSKRKLLPQLVAHIKTLEGVHSVADLFSGTARVGHALKGQGYVVHSNDHNQYAHALATCYVQADAQRWVDPATRLLKELQDLPPQPGYFTETFCERSRFFQPKNGAKIDAIREHIARLDLEPELLAIALVSLMEAADRVDSTAGVQMAYLKQWAPRAHKELELRVPNLLPGPGFAYHQDAEQCAQQLSCDLVYLDPPYNSHSYLGNYHVWESLVAWDKPEVYGVACKRNDCKTRKSEYNSKRKIHAALAKLVASIDARYLLLSFNNEGHVSKEELVEMLRVRGPIEVLEIPYQRYVGAKIGIHSPSGKRVGEVSHTKNLEYLFSVRVETPPTRPPETSRPLPPQT